MSIKDEINEYVPFNDQEKNDKEYFLEFMDKFDDVLTRSNIFGHITSSAFVVNKDRNKMLVVNHIILNGWIFPGGHADGEEDLLSVAIREVEEETGLKTKVLDEKIFAIQANAVASHIKKGKFVPSHIHFSVIYLLEADDSIPLSYSDEESRGVKWISFEDAGDDTIVPFAKSIHKKLIEKLNS